MNSEQEDFEKLRLLLSVKRYEQPPPGYFDRLPRDIIARLKAGEAHQSVSFFERLAYDAPWLQRLWNALETKPIVASSLGVGVCGVFLAVLALNMAPEASPEIGFPTAQSFSSQPSSSPLSQASVVSLPNFGTPTMFASTGGVLSLAPQIVSPQGRHPYAVPVGEYH